MISEYSNGWRFCKVEETRVRNAIDEGGFEGNDVSDDVGDRCGLGVADTF